MTSTLMSPEGPIEINARRTESIDAPHILKLVSPSTEQLFGKVNVVHLIEKSVLAVTITSTQTDELLAHAAFFDYPNAQDVKQSGWEQWMKSYYPSDNINALNTLFMHYFVSKPDYAMGCAKEIIRTLFNAVPDIHFCFLSVPIGFYPDPALSDIFSPLDKNEDTDAPQQSTLFACYRHDNCAVLHVRPAKIEDNDDLTPIFNRQSEVLTATYGDFFIAELIDAQDDGHYPICAEVDGVAVGLMSICSEVNVELLNEAFELTPFHGLRQPHPDDVLDPPKIVTPAPAPAPKASTKTQLHVVTRAPSNHESEPGDSAGKEADVVPSPQATPPIGSPTQSRGSSHLDLEIRTKLSDAHMDGSATSLIEGFESDVEQETISTPGVSPAPVEHISQPFQFLTTFKPCRPVFHPRYHGEAKAFCIQLFCIDERFEMRSCDFLNRAFELFPDKDYCVITIPHTVPEFPLLQNFVRVSPRYPSTLHQELYVFSKAGLMKSVVVRAAASSDYEVVGKLIHTVDHHENILKDLTLYNEARRDPDGTPVHAYVAEIDGQVVGIAIIRQEEDIEYIRSHYNIEDFIYFNHHRRDEHCHLHHFAMNPIFQHYSKHFIKEILRLDHKSCMYYPVYPPYVDEEVISRHSLVTVLDSLVPVKARRQIIYPIVQLKGNAPSQRITKNQDNYALYHINRKLTLEPKATVNARIVVVGASDVGLSLLETLAFCPHLKFNNLTMVSPHGLPGELPSNQTRDEFLSSSLCYNQDELNSISLRSWVNVISDKMIHINRKTKHIKVSGGAFVPFDHLILCTGSQYQVMEPCQTDVVPVLNDPLELHHERCVAPTPWNAVTVTDIYDADRIIQFINQRFISEKGNAIVYGASIDAYTCVQSLLDLGVEASRIHLVRPPNPYEPSCFNNPHVEQAVKHSLSRSGVHLHDDAVLSQWSLQDVGNSSEITSVTFCTDARPFTVDCSVLFSFYCKDIDTDAFKAINDSCLVYDGRLVVNTDFSTNDPSIFAAGPLTKFARKYHTDEWSHSNFNSKQVGQQLAFSLLKYYDPTMDFDSDPETDMLKLIPMYDQATMVHAKLPGNFNYLHIEKPKLQTSIQNQMAQQDYGRELITGSWKVTSGPQYFRLHLNQYQKVETVTCISRCDIDTTNLMCLFGVHERYLNNLMSRFDEGLITDFYSYFREPWCLAVFHDRFTDFMMEIRDILQQKQSNEEMSLEEKVRDLVEEDLVLKKEQLDNLKKEFDDLSYKRSCETRLLSFLSYNYYHLPMYIKPGMV